MAKSKDKSQTEKLLDFAGEQISKEYRRIDIINRKPNEIVIALLLLSSHDEAVEMLRAVHSADNIEGSQMKGVWSELARLGKRIQILTEEVESI